MAKYMIHMCPQREWYVNDFLIPSLLEQGIKSSDIVTYNDTEQRGNLESCMRAFLKCGDYDDEGVWHLQDDVCICSDFKERTERYDEGIVCGYCFNDDDRKRFIGRVKPNKMWFSFPCIRIPTKIAVECGKWFYQSAINHPDFRMVVRAKKYDDSVFEVFLLRQCNDIRVLNLAPNLVEHIDYMLGGSTVTNSRTEKALAVYFEDKKVVEDLQKRIDIYKNM